MVDPDWWEGKCTDSSFLNIFFMTYRSYMRPMELLQLIIRRYDGPDECHDDPETWPV